ncbi:hypothetical protein L1987_44971 [Smallanthus sonchifolius]|uniref:Uncharacterized protein n=1 Tax=Smallanthus sonchifolius TaxID=185202 RepID=A0ACB9GRX9_9ASTR|nr:hypothetical protein L1987_44971 [Smallanthus sonchifolius]
MKISHWRGIIGGREVLACNLPCSHGYVFISTDAYDFGHIVGGYWTDFPLSVLPIYKELIAASLRVWIFS